MAQREDRLDRYRRAVEACLGEHLSLARQDDFEPFFAHVISSFELGVDDETCALTWLAKAREGSVPKASSA